MSKRFLTSLRLLNLLSDPESAGNGDIYYNSSSNKTKVYQNGEWKNIASDIEDLSNVSLNNLEDGQVLTYVDSNSRWENKSTSSSGAETGTSFPISPSLGQFFFNTNTEKLYFFANSWSEISLITFNLDGGYSSTYSFEGVFDGGSSSTTSFDAGIYDAGLSI